VRNIEYLHAKYFATNKIARTATISTEINTLKGRKVL